MNEGWMNEVGMNYERNYEVWLINDEMNYECMKWNVNEVWIMNNELWIYEMNCEWIMNNELWMVNYELWIMKWIINYELLRIKWIMKY